MAALAPPWPAAVAVSGGSDSLALMLLLGDWAERSGRSAPVVLCVDHGLRPEARGEAGRVVAWAKSAGLKGHVLSYKGRMPASDIEAAARAVRYRLMGEWMQHKGLRALFVAHTRDDQAETFLLRVARGSGVDGLSGMRPSAPYPDARFPGLRLVRPLLSFDRQGLREYLSGRSHPWLDDPMNTDTRFARVLIRQSWPALEAIGLTRERVAGAAAHLGRARAALDAVSQAVLLRACRPSGNSVLVEARALTAAPREIGLRVLAGVLMAVSRNAYRPRFERLENLYDAIRDDSIGAGRTLHGCKIAPLRRGPAASAGHMLLIAPEKTRRSARKRAEADPTGS